MPVRQFSLSPELNNVVPLVLHAAPLFIGQGVRCADPDLKDHPAAPVMTQGTIQGFDTEKGDVLIILTGEKNGARRFKPYEITPVAAP